MTRTPVTAAQASAGLIYPEGYKWPGSTITYSIPGTGALWAAGYGRGEVTNAYYGWLDGAQAASFRNAVETWDAYIAPSLTEVSDSTPGDIRVAFTDASAIEGNPNIGAYAYSPPFPGSSPLPQSGDVWIDERYKADPFAARSQTFELLLHELGHSFGLKHPFQAPTLLAGYDSKTYTVMSYTNEDYFYTWSGGGGSINFSSQGTVDFTPMVLDISAIQSHYGRDPATGAGNTTYAFGDNDLNGRQAIYDASGTDKLDLSALSRGSNVDLRPGAYSDIAYYSVAEQENDLAATYGEGFRSFIRSTLNNPSAPAYEWEKNVGIAFTTTIENVIGSAGADNIIGNSSGNVINAWAGADTMRGLGGDDTYFVDAAADRVFEVASAGVDRVLTSVSYKLAANQHVETLTTTSPSTLGAINLTGNEFANLVIANAGDNVLNGGGGSDNLQGLAGADTYVVDAASDLVFEAAGAGADRILATVSYTLSASQEVEKLTTTSTAGTGAINLTGNETNQTLQGNAGANVLSGGSGADILTGFGGSDSFLFDAAVGAANRDVIRDFSHADDTIRLKQAVFSVLPDGQLAASAFKDIGDPGAVLDISDRVLYNDDTGALYYDQDGSGSTFSAQLFAVLATKPLNIDHTHFFIVA